MSKEEERTPDSVLIAIGELERAIEEAEASENDYLAARLREDLARLDMSAQEFRSVQNHRRAMTKHFALYEDEVRHAQLHRERTTVALERIADMIEDWRRE